MCARGRARVGDQRTILTVQQACKDFFPALAAVVFKVADQRLGRQVKRSHQFFGYAGIFGGDEIDLRHDLTGARGEVAKVADGRGDQIECTSRHKNKPLSLGEKTDYL